MEFRTEVTVAPLPVPIGYSDPVMFAGSCFASEMAQKMAEGLMPVLSNPAGVLYNPFSLTALLRNIISGPVFSIDDLWQQDGRWLSFSHHSTFSSEDAGECLEKINRSQAEAREFLSRASCLYVTFGTARIYRRKDNGEIVANCHKADASFFERELTAPADIVRDWYDMLDELRSFNPALRPVFTISPIRHWKDGAHGNQLSKSVLFVAVEELLRHSSSPAYFPSYEIVMDDLRDYRFYGKDMLHLSPVAVDYIWEKFSAASIDARAMELWREIAAVSRAAAHRIMSGSRTGIRAFASSMLGRISMLEKNNPSIDFSSLRLHFENMHG